MKNCLTFDDMYYYLTENKIATETLDRFSNITSHLLRCNKCAKKCALPEKIDSKKLQKTE